MADETPTVQAPRTPPTPLPENRLTKVWVRMPAFVRNFVIDAVEGAAATVGVVTIYNLLTAGSIVDAQAQALAIGAAVAVPVAAAFRRRIIPGVAKWLIRTFPRPE